MSDDRENPQLTYGALTNERGEFSIAPIPPGNCSVEAQRVGFVSSSREENYPLTSGSHRDSVKVSLTPTGAITGRVVNAAGEPVGGINITAEMANGNSSGAATDDKGEFRIGGLHPGKYRVKAVSQFMQFPPEIRTDGSVEPHDAATYYPDSLEAKSAQRVEVKAGAETNGVDIRLVQTPIVQVSGKVVGVPTGAKEVMVMAEPSGQMAIVKPDGSFTLWRLDPGKYTLTAQQWSGQPPLISAPIEIEIAGANLEHLELRLVPPFEIAGQLRFDDEQARDSPKPPKRPDGTSAPAPEQQRQVFLQPLEQQFVQPAAALAADDSFTLEKVQPAKYRVVVNGTSGYVKSVRAGETETDGDILDVRNGSAGPVTLTISSNFGEVSGTVTGHEGPMNHGYIILVSLEDPSITQSMGSDSGTYKFRVRPGKYRLAAVGEDALTWGLRGPDLDNDEFEIVDLSAGGKVTKDLVRRK